MIRILQIRQELCIPQIASMLPCPEEHDVFTVVEIADEVYVVPPRMISVSNAVLLISNAVASNS